MGYSIQYHEMTKVIIHLDKDNNILGLEIPEYTLSAKKVRKIEFPTTATCTCRKGLSGCVKEIPSKDIYVTMSCRWDSPGILDPPVIMYVGIDEKSLDELIDPDTESDEGVCQDYDPIGAQYATAYKCIYCSVLNSCENAHLTTGDLMGE